MNSNTHFARKIAEQAEIYGDRPAMHYRDNSTGQWLPVSWNTFAQQIESAAKALYDLGIKEYQTVGFLTQNTCESIVVDYANFMNRAISVPMYATSTTQQVEYIVNDAEIEILFVGEQTQYDVAYPVLKSSKILKKLIIFDDKVKTNGEKESMHYTDFIKIGEKSNASEEVKKRQLAASNDDLATIMYTSGTTGDPKGVMLPHSCYLEAMRIHDIRLPKISDKDTSISFLPLTHIFERAWTYLCFHKGVQVYVNMYPSEIQQTVKEVRPTMMCSVPRFWEKVYEGVQENIAKFSPLMQGIVAWAVAAGKRRNLKYARVGRKAHPWLALQYKIADKLIFSKVKNLIGIENGQMYPTAGAKLSDEITVFFRSIGVPIFYGYGLTETTATVTCFPYTHYTIGTVGDVMPDIDVKIGDDDEILLKGKTIFSGYYKKPEATAAAFTEDGYFRTGDAGRLENNQIVLTERIKDLFKTSNGKYIAPQQIESALSLDKYIEQIAVIGDERNYVTAIIAPSIENLKQYAQKEGIAYKDIDELLANKTIKEFYKKRIDEVQKDMAGFEKVKRFSFIKKGFTLEAGELTNTLKLRRAVILQKYGDLIEEMYNRKED